MKAMKWPFCHRYRGDSCRLARMMLRQLVPLSKLGTGTATSSRSQAKGSNRPGKVWTRACGSAEITGAHQPPAEGNGSGEAQESSSVLSGYVTGSTVVE
jgi:hypothetical protein